MFKCNYCIFNLFHYCTLSRAEVVNKLLPLASGSVAMLGKTFIGHVSVLNPQKWMCSSTGVTDNINDGSLTSKGLKKITSRFEGQPLEETY